MIVFYDFWGHQLGVQGLELHDDLIDFLVGLDGKARQELEEQLAGGATGLPKVAVTLALEGYEGCADIGEMGQGIRQLTGAKGMTPVFEGVEVASWRSGTGAFASARHGGTPGGRIAGNPDLSGFPGPRKTYDGKRLGYREGSRARVDGGSGGWRRRDYAESSNNGQMGLDNKFPRE